MPKPRRCRLCVERSQSAIIRIMRKDFLVSFRRVAVVGTVRVDQEQNSLGKNLGDKHAGRVDRVLDGPFESLAQLFLIRWYVHL